MNPKRAFVFLAICSALAIALVDWTGASHLWLLLLILPFAIVAIYHPQSIAINWSSHNPLPLIFPFVVVASCFALAVAFIDWTGASHLWLWCVAAGLFVWPVTESLFEKYTDAIRRLVVIAGLLFVLAFMPLKAVALVFGLGVLVGSLNLPKIQISSKSRLPQVEARKLLRSTGWLMTIVGIVYMLAAFVLGRLEAFVFGSVLLLVSVSLIALKFTRLEGK